jgi:hypothetical protein
VDWGCEGFEKEEEEEVKEEMGATRKDAGVKRNTREFMGKVYSETIGD